MSIDDRLRSAYSAPVEHWDVNAALDRVAVAESAQRTRRRIAGVTLAGAAASLVALLWGLAGPDSDRGLAPIDTPTSPSTTAVVELVPALGGLWETGPVSRADLRASLTGTGLARHLPAMLAELPKHPIRLTLEIEGNRVRLTVRGAGQPGEGIVIDEETVVSAESDQFSMQPFDPGENTYRWRIDGSGLHLQFLETTEDFTSGVPGEAWQRLLYTSAPFVAR